MPSSTLNLNVHLCVSSRFLRDRRRSAGNHPGAIMLHSLDSQFTSDFPSGGDEIFKLHSRKDSREYGQKVRITNPERVGGTPWPNPCRIERTSNGARSTGRNVNLITMPEPGGVSAPAACESAARPRHAYTWRAKKKETRPPRRVSLAPRPSCLSPSRFLAGDPVVNESPGSQ